jgi:hypothetical protein
MPQVGFVSTIPVFERAKTVDTLDRTATVIGSCSVMEAIKFRISWVQGSFNCLSTMELNT